MKRKILLLVLVGSFSGICNIWAQVIKLDLKLSNEKNFELGPYYDSEKGRDYTINRYEDKRRRTILKVLEPEGAIVTVSLRGRVIFEDDIPTMVGLREGFYRIRVRFKNLGISWNKKIEIKDGMVNILKVRLKSKTHIREYQDRWPEKRRAKAKRPMKGASFERLLEIVKEESFSKDRIGVIKVAAKHNFFSSRQVKRLLLVLDFDSTRLRAAKILYPRIVDRENIETILDAFEFLSTKNQFVDWMGKTEKDFEKNHEGFKRPIDEDEFSDLYDAMELSESDRERISIIKGSVEDNFFTAKQAAFLLELFDYDKNRLKAAKLLYKKITDKKDIEELYESFESLLYRNRFRRWVRKGY